MLLAVPSGSHPNLTQSPTQSPGESGMALFPAGLRARARTSSQGPASQVERSAWPPQHCSQVPGPPALPKKSGCCFAWQQSGPCDLLTRSHTHTPPASRLVPQAAPCPGRTFGAFTGDVNRPSVSLGQSNQINSA